MAKLGGGFTIRMQANRPLVVDDSGHAARIVAAARDVYGTGHDPSAYMAVPEVVVETETAVSANTAITATAESEAQPAPSQEASPPPAEPLPPPPVITDRPSPAKPATVVAPPEHGRGGPEHRYLQELIRAWGVDHGFRATVEETLPAGGRVDVSLRRGNFAVACEVAVTTSVEHELGNVRKCLDAGFDRVMVVTERKRFANALGKRLDAELSADVRPRVAVTTPADVLERLKEHATQSTEETIDGYTVSVNYVPITQAEAKRQRQTITNVLMKSWQRMKGSKE